MSFVDRSNTNWTPWPRLAHLPQRVVLVGGVATIMAGAAVMFKLRQTYGGMCAIILAFVRKMYRFYTEKQNFLLTNGLLTSFAS